MSSTNPNPNQPQTAYGPYSPIRQAGDLFFISGQVGLDPATKIAPPSVQHQTARAIANLKQVLEGAELTLNDVVKVTVFLTDMSDFTAMNIEYLRHFDDPRPARSAVAVAELPRLSADTPLLVEIEAIATRDSNTSEKQ